MKHLIYGLTIMNIITNTIKEDWIFHLKVQTLIISFFVFIALFFKNRLINLTNSIELQQNIKKLKLPLKESIKLIFSSKKLRQLFLILFSYGICNSFLETSCRYYLKQASHSLLDYHRFLGIQTMLVGIFTVAFILLGAYLSSLKKYSLSIIITPIFLLISSIPILYITNLLSDNWRLGPLLALSMFQLVLVKSSKYGLIDPVKEISYLSLDVELKNKGKAAIDSFSNRFGKTGGNFIQQMLFIKLQSIGTSINCFAIFICIFGFLWFNNAHKYKI